MASEKSDPAKTESVGLDSAGSDRGKPDRGDSDGAGSDTGESKGKRALVTGGSGVLGRHLAAALLSRGVTPRVFDLTPPPAGLEGVEFVKGDVSDAAALHEACRGCSAVFHLAGRMPQARLSEAAYRRVNVEGTRNAAEGCLRHGVPALIFASTIEIYGPQTDFPIREDAPKLFTGIYSRNKWECEGLLQEVRQRHGLRAAMMRMPMILGPGFYHERSVLEMMRRVRRGKPLPLPGGPEIPFTAVAASDAAAAFLAAWERREADGEAFNVAAGRGEPTRALFARFIQAAGSNSRIIPIPRWVMTPAIRLAVRLDRPLPLVGTPAELLPFALTGGDFDISKAGRVLGYRPRKDCLAALLETCRWLAEQGLL